MIYNGSMCKSLKKRNVFLAKKDDGKSKTKKKPAVKKPARKPYNIKKKTLDEKLSPKPPEFKDKRKIKARIKYPASKYDESMCDELIATLQKGNSRAHFCATHNISYLTFDNWRNKYEEFWEAYQVALPKSEKWWQDVAKAHVTQEYRGTELNHVVWSMNMRNRFGWTEHRMVKVPGLAAGKTFKDKFNALTASIESGKLTSGEVTAMAGLLTSGIKIAESAEIMDRIETLEKLLEQAQFNESISK